MSFSTQKAHIHANALTRMELKIDKLINLSLELLFPKKCLSCGREGSYVCAGCFSKIPIQSSFHCYLCQKRLPDGKICPECGNKSNSELTGLLIASDWRNLLIRQLIYECKYRFIKDLTQPLALIMAKFLTSNQLIAWPSPKTSELTNLKTDGLNIWPTNQLILVPVPLHKRRLSWRGFNQSKIICDHLAKYLDILTIDNLLIRGRHTPPQMGIKDRNEREQNIAGAFKLNHGKINLKGKIIILVDDVCTTGATLNECAGALKKLKPKEIWGLVIARG